MHNRSPILTMILILSIGISDAAVINIPDDHETILAGINAAEDGDTALAPPGEYFELIEIPDQNICPGMDGRWCAPRTSNPPAGTNAIRGEFDSHPFPLSKTPNDTSFGVFASNKLTSRK